MGDRRYRARDIANYSIVRLPDGMVGYLIRMCDGIKVVVGTLGIGVKPDDWLEVVRFPNELACEWLEKYYQGPQQESFRGNSLEVTEPNWI